ncbi:unnamed protein product, partial [Urochloa humidicola]
LLDTPDHVVYLVNDRSPPPPPPPPPLHRNRCTTDMVEGEELGASLLWQLDQFGPSYS